MKKESRILLTVAVIFSALVIGVLAAAASYHIVGARIGENGLQTHGRVYEQLPATETITRVETSNISDLSHIVDEVMPSIVAITSTTTTTYYNFFGMYDRDVQGSGSGIIFEKNDEELLIMTNNHVVSGAKQIQVTFEDGSMAEGVLRGTDSSSDLAVVIVDMEQLSAETKALVQPAKLGETTDSKVGQMVLAIGNALGYGQSLTVGYISARDRAVELDGISMNFLQTDAAINPGNSGGALINLQGEVIGINSAKTSAEAVEGMGYAIPMETALPILQELKSREAAGSEQGFLGVYYEVVSEEMHQSYRVPYGLYISKVMQGSAAEKAGLYAGDVMTALDGHELLAAADLQELMQTKRVGDTVVLTIQRYTRGGYRELEVTVQLGKNPQQ